MVFKIIPSISLCFGRARKYLEVEKDTRLFSLPAKLFYFSSVCYRVLSACVHNSSILPGTVMRNVHTRMAFRPYGYVDGPVRVSFENMKKLIEFRHA